MCHMRCASAKETVLHIVLCQALSWLALLQAYVVVELQQKMALLWAFIKAHLKVLFQGLCHLLVTGVHFSKAAVPWRQSCAVICCATGRAREHALQANTTGQVIVHTRGKTAAMDNQCHFAADGAQPQRDWLHRMSTDIVVQQLSISAWLCRPRCWCL